MIFLLLSIWRVVNELLMCRFGCDRFLSLILLCVSECTRFLLMCINFYLKLLINICKLIWLGNLEFSWI